MKMEDMVIISVDDHISEPGDLFTHHLSGPALASTLASLRRLTPGRLALVAEGLPEPELQVKLDPSDRRSPAADLGYRRYRIAVQYDGATHLTREQQSRDNRRDEAFLSAGWAYFKVNADDLAEGFESVIARIKRTRPRRV